MGKEFRADTSADAQRSATLHMQMCAWQHILESLADRAVGSRLPMCAGSGVQARYILICRHDTASVAAGHADDDLQANAHTAAAHRYGELLSDALPNLLILVHGTAFLHSLGDTHTHTHTQLTS